MNNKITIKNIINLNQLKKMLRKVVFRGLYNQKGEPVRPYENVRFTQAIVYPQKKINESPELAINKRKKVCLYTSQPTIYQNQINVLMEADKYLREFKINMDCLEEAIEYDWKDRGKFHMLPPIIEKHTYYLKNGYINLDELLRRFKNKYVRDGCHKLHHLSDGYLKSFCVDEVSTLDYLSIFNSNAPIINYGLNYNGRYDFYIICDGAHRLDYVVENLNKPIKVIVVEPFGKDMIPYYALPVSFRPSIRLSSKRSEKMYHKLERDKIHLLNDFIKKILHYDWEAGGLKVGKLRSNVDIY